MNGERLAIRYRPLGDLIPYAANARTHSEDQVREIAASITEFGIRGEGVTVTRMMGTVILEDKPTRSAEHPTMKPVALIERMLVNSTKRGNIVLDLFGGGGSTLMACEGLGRAARLMELDGKFVDVIVRRWQDETGKEAVHVASGLTFAQVATDRGAG